MRYLIFLFFVVISGFSLAQNTVKDTIKGDTNNSIYKIAYSGSIEAGYDCGIMSFWNPGFGMDRAKTEIVNGLRLNPFISLGVGTGLHYYFDFDEKKIWSPVFLNMKLNGTNKKFSPVFSISGGYSFDIKNDFEKVGFLVNSLIGVKYKVWNKFSLIAGIGLEMQKIEVFLWDEPAYFNAITLNLGLTFN